MEANKCCIISQILHNLYSPPSAHLGGGLCCLTGIKKVKDGLFISTVCFFAGNRPIKMQSHLPVWSERLWEPGDGWRQVFFFFFTEAAADFIIVTESALIIWFLRIHIKVSPAQEQNTFTLLVNSEHAAYSRCAVSNKAIDIFFDHWNCLPLRNTGERIKRTVCFSVYQLDSMCVVCGCVRLSVSCMDWVVCAL